MPARRAYLAGWALVLAAGAYLRLWAFGAQIVIDDEWHALNKLLADGYGGIFLSFGHADHSIPLTLYYKVLADTVGLSEWGMQLPMLVFGLAAIVVIPWLLRHWTTPAERLGAGALIAVSPFLVHFSRLARPYAIIVVLCLAAVVCFYHWWRQGDTRALAAYVACTALAAWLHPVNLAFTLAPFVWAGAPALAGLARRRDAAPLKRLVLAGVAITVPLLVLLGPPLWHDLASLAVKAGTDYPGWWTFVIAWELFAGTGHHGASLAGLALAVFGAWRLGRREPAFWGYCLCLSVVATVLVSASGAAWAHQGIVLAGYLLPLQPLVLVCLGAGLAGLAPAGVPARRMVQAAVAALALVALYLMGPLPEQYSGRNQFTGHMVFQYDYDRERSDYRRALADIPVPDFYRRMARAGEGWQVVEAPWRLESHFNPLYKYQRVHQLPVKIGFLDGLCAEGLYGEYPAHAPGLAFEHFAHLSELLEDPPERTFLVIHREAAGEGWRELPSVEPCIQAFRERYDPWIESAQAVVFRFD